MSRGDILWKPRPDQRSQMTEFREKISRLHPEVRDYSSLHRYSTVSPEFWEIFRRECGFRFRREADSILKEGKTFQEAEWFAGALLNPAENLLRHRDSDSIAMHFFAEDTIERKMSYRELASAVHRLASFFRENGIVKGDRVAGFLPNMPEAVITMLAAHSVGAVYTSCSPDFGIEGVLDRFGQIQPAVLVTAESYLYKGKNIDLSEKNRELSRQLSPRLKLRCSLSGTLGQSLPEGCYSFHDLPEAGGEMIFEEIRFHDPIYIMYSSGTTGKPKCMVQGSGVILNHIKEQQLHCDLRPQDVIFYFTTCGWMMWNWLCSALFTGATLVLFDGNPFHPGPEILWKVAGKTGMTVFGTSAKYIDGLATLDFRPVQENRRHLRLMLSTGSPLSPEGFRYVHDHIDPELQLCSISGGTDLNGCFALGNPDLPVHEGELQCRGLGMAVEIFNEEGKPVRGELGELVCTRPFPSMPLYFWDDANGEKYRAAYFEKWPAIWRHGDFAELTEHDGIVIHGRSDATLNPGGVRIGTAEIYRVVEKIPGIADSLVIGQQFAGDVRVVLFLKMLPGANLDDSFRNEIRGLIRSQVSPRHVPEKIIPVADIPYTRNMKKVELAVRDTVHGRPVRNTEALINPESLICFQDLPELNT